MNNQNEEKPIKLVEKNSTIENFQTLEELEKEHFFKAMKLAKGNKNQAALMLGITIKSVYNKIEKYYEDNLEIIKKDLKEGEEL